MNITVTITLKGGEVLDTDIDVNSLDEARVAKVDMTWNEGVAVTASGSIANSAAPAVLVDSSLSSGTAAI